MKKFLTILVAILTLASCQSLNSRGTFIDDSTLDQMKNQKMSKDQLILNIGLPTLKPDYSPNKWYYVSRIVRNRPWSEPKLIKQRIIEVAFDGDHVDKIEVLETRKQPSFKISQDETISKGTEENAIQTFIKNFGRFNKTSRSKRR